MDVVLYQVVSPSITVVRSMHDAAVSLLNLCHCLMQVACGLNFTVALTTNGQVLQMGSTGNNSTEHNALWEGARVPVLVGGALAPVCATSIACGTSHIAVVASVRPQPNERSRSLNGNSAGAGSADGGRERMRLLTWGRGGAGQLGLGGDGRGREPKDHNLPQVGVAVTTSYGKFDVQKA